MQTCTVQVESEVDSVIITKLSSFPDHQAAGHWAAQASSLSLANPQVTDGLGKNVGRDRIVL